MNNAASLWIVRYVAADGSLLFKDALVTDRTGTLLRGITKVEGEVTDFRQKDFLQAFLGRPFGEVIEDGKKCPNFDGQDGRPGPIAGTELTTYLLPPVGQNR